MFSLRLRWRERGEVEMGGGMWPKKMQGRIWWIASDLEGAEEKQEDSWHGLWSSRGADGEREACQMWRGKTEALLLFCAANLPNKGRNERLTGGWGEIRLVKESTVTNELVQRNNISILNLFSSIQVLTITVLLLFFLTKKTPKWFWNFHCSVAFTQYLIFRYKLNSVHSMQRLVIYIKSLMHFIISMNDCQSRIWTGQNVIQKHLFVFGITNHFGMLTDRRAAVECLETGLTITESLISPRWKW